MIARPPVGASRRRRALVACLAAVACWFVMGDAAAARILTTRRPVSALSLNNLLIGSDFEYTPDPVNPDYIVTLATEYKLSESFKLGFETNYDTITCSVTPKNPTKSCGAANGIGDLDLAAEWEFLHERRYRPSIAFVADVKFAVMKPFGTGHTDTDIGVIVAKDYPRFAAEVDAVYTFIGSGPKRGRENMIEVAASTEIHLNHHWDLEGEVVWSKGGALFPKRGSVGGGQGNAPQEDGTIGFAYYPNEFLKFEEGLTIKSDGSRTIVVGWEYEFGGR